MNGVGRIVNVPVKEIPRTLKQRKKNWKCNYPGCNETPKTRYNCYAHVWDSHIKPFLSQTGNNPENLILTSFKNYNDKDQIKKICEKYMIKLVDKTHGRQTYPFAFTESIAPIIGVALNQMQSKENNGVINQNNQTTLKLSQQMLEIPQQMFSNNGNTYISFSQQIINRSNEINKTESETNDIVSNASHPYQSIEDNSNEQEYNVNDLLKIKRIGNKLQQLHMLGEIFANEGFLVRSDERSKNQIESINNALYGLSQLYGRQFKYLTDSDKIAPRYGFIAQEVKEIYPDLVMTDEEGGLSVDYLGIIPIMVEALKDIEKATETLNSKNQKEYKVLSSTVQNTVSQLMYVEKDFEQRKEEIMEPLMKKRSANAIKHCFGPTYFLSFMAIIFSISSLIVPLIKPLYLIEATLIFISCLLWVFVIINNKEAKELIVKKETLLQIFKGNIHWGTLQITVWSIIITSIFCSITITLIVGIMGILISSLYILVFISLITMLLLIYFNCSHHYRSFIILIVLCSFHIIGGICLVSTISFQPFKYFELTQYNTITSIQTNVNQTIVPVALPSLPWNCYDPIFMYSEELPNGLELDLQSKYLNRITPTLKGKVTKQCIYNSSVKLQCGVTKINYTTISLVAF